MKFTRHNLRLPSGEITLEGKPLLAETQRFLSIRRLLQNFFSHSNEVSIADLGCLEGGYACELARLGYLVTGIEARSEHLEKCNYLKESYKLDNLNFIQDDVRNLENHGPFDVSYVAGLLYHLDKPVDFINSLGKVTQRMVILNTAYATDRVPSRYRHKLSKITENEAFRGRWYQEQPDLPRSSFENPRSFWLLKDSLLSALRQAGFETIFEQFDCHWDMTKALQAIHRNNRGVFVGIKALTDRSAN